MASSSTLTEYAVNAAPTRTIQTRWQPEISRVVPVVRWAVLVRHEPRLEESITARIAAILRDLWPEWKERYRAAVAERADLPLTQGSVDGVEVVRFRKDGKTPMIDFPRVQSGESAFDPFDVRLCAALCIEESYSSKFWARVGPPFGRGTRGFSVQNLPQVLRRYRSLAKSCSEWFHDEIVRIAGDALSDRREQDEGALEVTTVGLYVQGEQHTDDDLEAWLIGDDGQPNFANEQLCRFMKEVTGIDYDLREVEKREKNAFWMSMPMAVQLKNGDLASRKALYLVRPVDNLVQVVGVGLDDSRSGDFASEVALKVSRFVANRI